MYIYNVKILIATYSVPLSTDENNSVFLLAAAVSPPSESAIFATAFSYNTIHNTHYTISDPVLYHLPMSCRLTSTP